MSLKPGKPKTVVPQFTKAAMATGKPPTTSAAIAKSAAPRKPKNLIIRPKGY